MLCTARHWKDRTELALNISDNIGDWTLFTHIYYKIWVFTLDMCYKIRFWSWKQLDLAKNVFYNTGLSISTATAGTNVITAGTRGNISCFNILLLVNIWKKKDSYCTHIQGVFSYFYCPITFPWYLWVPVIFGTKFSC